MKTFTLQTSPTKTLTFTHAVDHKSRIDIALNGEHFAHTFKGNLNKGKILVVVGEKTAELPLDESRTSEYLSFQKNATLRTFKDLDERNEYIGDKGNFGTFWYNDNNEVCVYEYES